jgi:type IV secretory pathway TrbL component
MKILFITFLLFCYNNISEKNQIHINNFSSKQWIFDSLACDNYRDTAV